jgi:mRNA interferase MazF
MCPITSRIKGYPFEVTIPAGLPVTGVVLSDQVKSLDWRVRHAERISALPGHAVTEIRQKLGALLA